MLSKRVILSLLPYFQVGWQKAFHTNYVASGEHVFNVHHNHVYNYGMEILNDFGGIYLSTNIADCKDKQVCLESLKEFCFVIKVCFCAFETPAFITLKWET